MRLSLFFSDWPVPTARSAQSPDPPLRSRVEDPFSSGHVRAVGGLGATLWILPEGRRPFRPCFLPPRIVVGSIGTAVGVRLKAFSGFGAIRGTRGGGACPNLPWPRPAVGRWAERARESVRVRRAIGRRMGKTEVLLPLVAPGSSLDSLVLRSCCHSRQSSVSLPGRPSRHVAGHDPPPVLRLFSNEFGRGVPPSRLPDLDLLVRPPHHLSPTLCLPARPGASQLPALWEAAGT